MLLTCMTTAYQTPGTVGVNVMVQFDKLVILDAAPILHTSAHWSTPEVLFKKR